jgi:RNA polymerase sigma-70 factor (ECF subfamily)
VRRATNIARRSHVFKLVTDGGIAVATTAEGVVGDAAEPRLGELFETHHRRLYKLARRLVSTPDEARDLVQETFLRAVRAPRSVPWGMPAEEAWLVRVLVNLCRDRWRNQTVQRRFRERYDINNPRASAPAAEAAFIAQNTIWRALRELPPRRRAVLVLHELEGASMPEIARLLGVAAVTVRWHLSRGRRELTRIIKEECGS